MPKKRPAAASGRTPIESHRHREKRKNIPTEELRDFVREEDEQAPAVLYPRDPSLDPQLVWKGKDEQDSAPLAVPTVPIYIQEKIHPQAIIEDFRASLASGEARGEQLTLFGDFNGLPQEFDQRVDFYRHEGNWSNRLILGDSLLVMNSLAEKEGLRGQVQMIYLDPPYGIKFGSNWQVSTRRVAVTDGKREDATRQPEQIKAFRDTWQLGLHSYLAYIRDRLVVSRELLTETGSIFVQIGVDNVHLIRCVLDEVFGGGNFCSLITFKKTGASTVDLLPSGDDYILWYARNRESVKFRQVYQERQLGDDGTEEYQFLLSPTGETRTATQEELLGVTPLPEGLKPYRPTTLTSSHHYSLGVGNVEYQGRTFLPGTRYWSTSPEGIHRLGIAGRLLARRNELGYLRFLDDFAVLPYTTNWSDTMMSSRSEQKSYVVQSSVKVIQRCLLMTTDPGDLVVDPTCGSGTTAVVAEQWGRRWITTDTSRVALTLARTRIMAARFPYYLMADSPEGRAKEREISGETLPVVDDRTKQDGGDLRKGLVYKRVPHVTLKAIANNEEIDAIHARWQEKLEPVRGKLNKLLKQQWEEWQIPRQPEEAWPKDARTALDQWWELRRGRQREIDESIARQSETETLYDQPYEDPRRVRVSGPFTVESLSPHRTMSVAQRKDLAVEFEGKRAVKVLGPDKFGLMIMENLRKAGVQNTKKNERLKFDSLEPYAGQWIHAEGRYTENDGKARRAAVCIGPEFGTVGPELVKEAAKEAVQGVGFDVLVVCGFAFDPHVSEEARRYGKLVVLPCRMNPDLAMGDELLKKTGAGNLFMVFGEPDIEIRRVPATGAPALEGSAKRPANRLARSSTSGASHGRTDDERLVVEIKGLDVYDPTTGEIRSSSTDDIACWFIDTNYNGEAFFVRHAYFLGADEPYEKLKRALRAEIDEGAWNQLYSPVSRPFPIPETGKIAVKVINHYGDEVLKVWGVRAD
jgi:adenine-specific DNA-methyltransferase